MRVSGDIANIRKKLKEKQTTDYGKVMGAICSKDQSRYHNGVNNTTDNISVVFRWLPSEADQDIDSTSFFVFLWYLRCPYILLGPF